MLSPALHAEGVATEVIGQEGGRFIFRPKATNVTFLTNTIITQFHLGGVGVSKAGRLEHALRVAVVALQEHLTVPLC